MLLPIVGDERRCASKWLGRNIDKSPLFIANLPVDNMLEYFKGNRLLRSLVI